MSNVEEHRQRLCDRFNASGLGAFADHEILELLLTYVVPRKDVKPIAHVLLECLGSLSNVLDAPTTELVKVDGVGRTGATPHNLIPALSRRYLLDRWGHRPQINTRENLGRFVVDELASAPVYPHIVEAAVRHRAPKVVLTHKHPGSVAQPSEEDLSAIRTLVLVFDAHGVPVVDHLIVEGHHTISMAEVGTLRANAAVPT